MCKEHIMIIENIIEKCDTLNMLFLLAKIDGKCKNV